MARHILLIDGNSIAHANHNATPLTVGKFQVQAIFGFLRTLRLLMETTPGDVQPLILWDGRAQWRIDIYADYKGNRKPMDAKQAAHKEAFKAQTPFIEKALEYLGVMQLRSPLLEADDLAGHLVAAMPGKPITLVSGDQDWLQLVNEDVSWFDPIRDRRVDLSNFLDSTGYHSTAAFVHGKCLQGDTSDNVPGIPGMGEKGAQLFMAKWNSVDNFYLDVDHGLHTPATRKSKTATSKHPEEILASDEGRQQFARNLKLMSLLKARKPAPGEVITVAKQPDPERFKALCERLMFASILRQMPQFLRALNVKVQPAVAEAA